MKMDLLQRDQVLGLFNNKHQRSVPAGIIANRARVRIRQVETNGAMLDSALDLSDRAGEPCCIVLAGFENVKREPFRGPPTDAGQLGELVDQFVDRSGIGRARTGGVLPGASRFASRFMRSSVSHHTNRSVEPP